jgi:hypothetical protein
MDKYKFQLDVESRGSEKTFNAGFEVNDVSINVAYWWTYTEYGVWQFNLVFSGGFLKRDLYYHSGARSSIYKGLCELKSYSPPLKIGFDQWSVDVLELLFQAIEPEYGSGLRIVSLFKPAVGF